VSGVPTSEPALIAAIGYRAGRLPGRSIAPTGDFDWPGRRMTWMW